jgi:hypothetical protein
MSTVLDQGKCLLCFTENINTLHKVMDAFFHSWLENFIIGLFKKLIKRQVEDAINIAIVAAINTQLDGFLKSLPLKIPIQGLSCI